MDVIPTELIDEILSRLPAKSIARFHCVSKQWSSILDRSYFKDLFRTRSSSHPRLLFVFKNTVDANRSIFSASLAMKFPPDNMRIYQTSCLQFSCSYASGLIYFYAMWINKNDKEGVPVVCNPTTGRYTTLPSIHRDTKADSFLGFDPIDKQYKVLFMANPASTDDHMILTLGNDDNMMTWRKIECSLVHRVAGGEMCINGVLYYLGDYSYGVTSSSEQNFVIVCFDVRSEKFKFIYVEKYCEQINYNGKLGVVYYDDYNDLTMKKFRFWVLEDAEKEEWSKFAYTLKDDRYGIFHFLVVGATSRGEFILSDDKFIPKQPFYVFYFNPERNSLRRVEIHGFREYGDNFPYHCNDVYVFGDYVEDLNANDPKLLKSSINVPFDKEEEEGQDKYMKETNIMNMKIKKKTLKEKKSIHKKKIEMILCMRLGTGMSFCALKS